MSDTPETKKRKPHGDIVFAIVHVRATHNNTSITVTDAHGGTLCWASAGSCGFKGARRSTPFAGRCAAQKIAEETVKLGVREVEIRIKGDGPGLDGAIQTLQSAGWIIRKRGQV